METQVFKRRIPLYEDRCERSFEYPTGEICTTPGQVLPLRTMLQRYANGLPTEAAMREDKFQFSSDSHDSDDWDVLPQNRQNADLTDLDVAKSFIDKGKKILSEITKGKKSEDRNDYKSA